MAHLVYSAIASLDGFVADANGAFDWAAPDEEVHAFANQLEAGIGTHLLGRRMYDVMRFWDGPVADDWPPEMREYARLWQSVDKVVYSTTLRGVAAARTQLARSFDPEQVRQWKASSSRDLSVGGPTLAAAAWRAGLVDDVHLWLVPVMVGDGTRALPGGVRTGLTLVDQQPFGNGTTYLHYRVRH